MPYSSLFSLLSLAGSQQSHPGPLAARERDTKQGAQEGRRTGDGAPGGPGEEETEPWGAGRGCAHPGAWPCLRRRFTEASLSPVEFSLCRDCPSRAAQQEPPLPAGVRDRALPVGCHLSASPGASGTDPALPPGPLPAGKLLCSHPTMHSKSTAGKERAKLLFWPGMC